MRIGHATATLINWLMNLPATNLVNALNIFPEQDIEKLTAKPEEQERADKPVLRAALQLLVGMKVATVTSNAEDLRSRNIPEN